MQTHSFVVNVWEERRDINGAEPMWRGSVVDVQDGNRIYFDSLLELCDFLERRSGMQSHRLRWRDWLRWRAIRF